MFRSRNSLLLLAVAVVAFAAFLWVESRSGKQGAPDAVERGASLMEGGRSGPESGQSAAERERKKQIATLKARSRRASSEKPQEAADPELLAQLPRASGPLVAAGPPRSPREGIVQQSFKGRERLATSTKLAGGPSGDKDQGPDDETAGDCSRCGSPVVRTVVVDVEEQPEMIAAYEKPCGPGSLVVPQYGERFTIGDAPACAWLLPNCNGGAAALFDKKYVVSAHGTCIPSLEYIKAFMQR